MSRTPTQRELMLAGERYIANDPELNAARRRARGLLHRFNDSDSEAFSERAEILRALLGSLGSGSLVNPTFKCDYGFNISIGKNSFLNFDCVFLDCNRIEIGDEVQIGPGVHVYTATHPLGANERRHGYELARPVSIASGVWIGGKAVICPGVTIGEDTVVGAGSVVTGSLPGNVLAAGNPCRVIRPLDK